MSSTAGELLKKHSNNRIFYVFHEGTLGSLSTSSHLDITDMLTPRMLKYPRVGSNSTDDVGNPNKADIFRVSIVSVENTSRTDIMLNMVEPAKESTSQPQIIQGNEFHRSRGSEEKDESSPSVRALALIQRTTRETYMLPRDVFLAGDATYSDGNHVLGSFDSLDIDRELEQNVHTIMKTGKKKTKIIIEPGSILQNLYQSVSVTHPKMVASAENRPDGKVELSWSDFEAMNAHWKKTHSKYVTKVDMTSLVFRIAPAGFTWEEFVNKLKNENSVDIHEILNTKFVFKVGLSIDYMLGGHYIPDQVSNSSSSPSSSSSSNRRQNYPEDYDSVNVVDNSSEDDSSEDLSSLDSSDTDN